MTGPNQVPIQHTGGPTWMSDRFAELAANGIDGDVAKAIVAQWGLETGFGASEWNFNVGNIVALPGQPYISLQADPAPHSNLRAYLSLAQGVASYLALVRSAHYSECWAKLQADPHSGDWIDCLGLKGYYTAPRHTYIDAAGKVHHGYVESYLGALARVQATAPTVTGCA